MSIPTPFNPMGTLGGELPPGYVRLMYLQSSGTQYIDTGKNPDSLTRWEVETELMGDGFYPQGCGSMEDGNRFFTLAALYGTWITITGNAVSTYFSEAPKRVVAIMDMQAGTAEIGGYKKEVPMSETVPQSIILFSRGIDGGVGQNGPFKNYYSKIYSDGKLIQHLVPALRVADNKPGMYDLVGKTFFVNSGRGEFTTDLDE